MNKLAFALSLSMFSMVACTDAAVDEAKNFVGSYKTTVTVTGGQTLSDSLIITEGTTSDLVVTSQVFGSSMKATIISETALSIDQQQILINNSSVTVEGSATVITGLINGNLTGSNANGTAAFTIAGQKL